MDKLKRNTIIYVVWVTMIVLIATLYNQPSTAKTKEVVKKQVVTCTTSLTTAPMTAPTKKPKGTPTAVKSTEPEGKAMTLTATAYCDCYNCCGKTDGITATGTKATAGRTIAVDPDLIPYGSKVIINGNTYIAEDCGGAIQSNRVDIFFDSHSEALEWGVRKVEALVISQGEVMKLEKVIAIIETRTKAENGNYTEKKLMQNVYEFLKELQERRGMQDGED